MKSILSLTLFSLVFFSLNAQNVSYNGDAIPVNGIDNTALGVNVLANVPFSPPPVSSYNVGIGKNILTSSNLIYYNTAIGHSALQNNGIYCTATGYGALNSNDYLVFTGGGGYNTGTGAKSLYNNVFGTNNSAFGYNSLYNLTNGSYNTALGSGADVASGTLTNSTAIGYGAIVNASNTMQLGNSFVTQVYAGTGTNATLVAGGLQITGGSLAAGKVLTSDAFGVATWQTPSGGGGGWSLLGNGGTVDGTNFIGTTDKQPFNIRVNNRPSGRIDAALYNTFFGALSGSTITSGLGNTGVGANSLGNITTGVYNTSLGYYSLANNASGSQNIAIGPASLFSNTSGGFNTSVGINSLYYNTSGGFNTASGVESLRDNTSGDKNTAMGGGALAFNTTGFENTAVGYQSLQSNTTGDNVTGLGNLADVAAANLKNATVIGAKAIVNASDEVRVGNASVLRIEGAVVFSTSDLRFKKNITDNEVKGLEFINRLHPVVYNFDTRKFQEFLTHNMPDSIKHQYFDNVDFTRSTSIRQSGFIAQEVEKVAQETGYNFSGLHTPDNENDNYSLAYGQFVVPLVKAVQELSDQNELLRKEMDELKQLIKTNAGGNIEGSIKINESNDAAKLFQNVPNPFNQSTIIRYSIPSTSQKAFITITSISGTKIREFNLKNNENQNIEIKGGQLSAGSYIYTLIVDGKLIDSKQMILTP
ncbi:tail fiber domain-containing protein [Ferruginibacter sp.]